MRGTGSYSGLLALIERHSIPVHLMLFVPAPQLVNWIGGDTLDGQATMAAFTCTGTEAATYRVCRTAAEAGTIINLPSYDPVIVHNHNLLDSTRDSTSDVVLLANTQAGLRLAELCVRSKLGCLQQQPAGMFAAA